MNYISVEGLRKTYGERVIFENITFGINQGEKIALVGINGCGKSTLLKIISGLDTSDSGNVSINKSITVSYLDQTTDFPEDMSVQKYLFEGDSEILRVIKKYGQAINDPNADSDELQQLIMDMDRLQAWDYENEISQILTKLSITDLNANVGSLSGGQKKRVALAKVLVSNPNLIILDEPTNHLDIEAIEWLESYLSTSNLAILMVTHDRYFLEKVTKEIIEIDNGVAHRYSGNYQYFLEKKAERETIEATEVDKAKNLMKKELEWMRRQPKARGTKAKYRVEAFHELEKTATKDLSKQAMELKINSSRQGRKILELEHISKSFGDLKIMDDFTYTFKRQDRIGIVGKNGVGKSTFLKIITGFEQHDSGEIDKGQTIKIGHYKQEEPNFPGSKKVIDVVKEKAEILTLDDGSNVSASQFLNLFLFPPKRQYDFISKLSGGEKRRLQLLTILIERPNFLILDEPTNDLDIQTLNVLEDYLEAFGGCLMVVTHDRYFLDRLVDQLFIFEGDGQIRSFPGNYSDYRTEQSETERKNSVGKTVTDKPVKQVKNQSVEKKKKLSFKEQQEFEELEKVISDLEEKKASLVNQLNAGSENHEELAKWSAEIEQIVIQLDEKEMRWLELSERL